MRIQQQKLMDTVQTSSHGGKYYSPRKVMIPSMNEQASDEQLTVQRVDVPKKVKVDGHSRVKVMTYAFSGFAESCILSRDDIKSAVAFAFQSWAAVIQYDFQETNDFEAAEIKIQFIVGDHSHNWPFDGPLPTVAHGDRRIQLDSDKVWTVDMAVTDDKFALDLESVALHKIGHLIGLVHSKIPCSIMFSDLKPRKVKRRLTCDDIEAAMALYRPRMSAFKELAVCQHVCNQNDPDPFLVLYLITFAYLMAIFLLVVFWLTTKGSKYLQAR
jgi:hypothetical protein